MHLHNFAMLKVVFVLSIVIFSCADLRTRCGNGTETNLTFTPSKDGVSGRYTAELCTNVTKNITQWKLDIMINSKNGYCNQTHHRSYPGPRHSEFLSNVNVDGFNCSYVCLSTDFDLIYSSCYLLKSIFTYGRIDSVPFDFYQKIINQFDETNITAPPKIIPNNHENGVGIHLYPGVPPTEYNVSMEDRFYRETDVTANCTSTPTSPEIYCYLTPPYGCYSLSFTFQAPWLAGQFTHKSPINYEFCHKKIPLPEISGTNWGVVWACAGVLAACVCAFFARCAWRTRTAAKIREQVRRNWVEHRTDTETTLQENKSSCKHILLLYAREGEAGQRVVALLKGLLSQVIPGNVYDIFSAEVMSMSACAPAQWMRDVLEQPEVRVVLVQTPALACLYQAHLEENDTTFRLREPLLGSSVTQRSPHFGDTLLHYALRLIAETPRLHAAYDKCYVANLSELKVEIFPQVVRFTRYSLPGATGLLLRDVSAHSSRESREDSSREPTEDSLKEFSEVVAQFVHFATNNPNYLMDELMFVS